MTPFTAPPDDPFLTAVQRDAERPRLPVSEDELALATRDLAERIERSKIVARRSGYARRVSMRSVIAAGITASILVIAFARHRDLTSVFERDRATMSRKELRTAAG